MSFYCPTVGQWKGGGSSSVETFMCPQAFAERSLIGQFDFVTLTDWTYFNFSWAFMKFRIDFLLDPSFVSWSYYCQVFEFLGIINDINDLDWLTQSNEGVWISGKLFPLSSFGQNFLCHQGVHHHQGVQLMFHFEGDALGYDPTLILEWWFVSSLAKKSFHQMDRMIIWPSMCDWGQLG